LEKLKTTGIGNGVKPLPRVQHDTKHKANTNKRRDWQHWLSPFNHLQVRR